MKGFLEESTGGKSMTRLSIAWLLALTTAVVSALVFYVVKVRPVEAGVVTAFGVPLGALVWHGIVSIKSKTSPEPAKDA